MAGDHLPGPFFILSFFLSGRLGVRTAAARGAIAIAFALLQKLGRALAVPVLLAAAFAFAAPVAASIT